MGYKVKYNIGNKTKTSAITFKTKANAKKNISKAKRLAKGNSKYSSYYKGIKKFRVIKV